MNPTFIDSMSWEMAEVYGAITDQILINLAHYFPYFKPGSPVPRSSFTYQATMLAQMGKVNNQTARIIANGLGGANTALVRVIEQAIIESVGKAEPGLLRGVMSGILKPQGVPIVSPNQTRAFQLYYTQAAQKLNLVNTVMLESTQSAYQATVADIASRMRFTQTALDVGAGEVVTGVSSWNTATKHAIDRMKQTGITGFIDHAGRHWSAEAYVAMDIRTTVANTARAAVWETNQNFGNDLYQVSYHDGARPLCYPWQNKVISSTDNARTTVDLDGNEIHVYAQSETTYGEPAGLFGINCKHYPTPFIPGVSIIRGTPQDEEANAKTYAESQQQRALERRLREEKRDLLMMKAQGAPEEMIEAQRARVRSASADIADFCDETGRARHRDREGVYTERRFPAADTYDVTEFENKQREMIQGFYSVGGAQVEYNNVPGMVPNVPLVPKATPVVGTVPTDTPDMKYGKPLDYENQGYRKPQQAQFADAKATLDAAPENVRAIWSKCADDFNNPSFGAPGVSGAHYSPSYRKTYYKTYKEAFEESAYQRKNTVFFHEYGHNIDHALGGFARTSDGYLSVSYNGGIFGRTIAQECEDAVKAFYSTSGLTVPITDKKVGTAFAKWVKDTYNLYERSDISDMFEKHMITNYGIDYPFGVGHGKDYHFDSRMTPIEAFAEMYSATVTGSESLGIIKQFFPKSYEIFVEMLESVL